MYYVIMDLEWNNSYSKAARGLVNEILEIGAVMVSDKLEIIDTFSVIVKSQLIRKLSGRIKQLTHITNEDMLNGISFNRAVSDFTKWLDGRSCIFMSWGNADIRVMNENFSMFCGISRIPFLTQYCDLQQYCQAHIVTPPAQQVGLDTAALQMGVDTTDCQFHRALEDSLIGLRCLKKCYDKDELMSRSVICDSSFYDKLVYKAHFVSNIDSSKVDRSKMVCNCGICKKPMKRVSDWKTVNQAFRALFYCKDCDRLELFTIRFKEYYDRIEVRHSQVPLNGSKNGARQNGADSVPGAGSDDQEG